MLNNMKVLVGLLILVAGLAYWVSASQQQSTSIQQPLIPAWQQTDEAIDAIDQVSITQGSEQLLLTKADGEWTINAGFYVSIEPLFNLMQALKSAEIIEAKTANPEKHAQLELAENDMKVTLYEGEAVKQAFYVGKQSTAGLTFVRRVDEDQTYTVKGLRPISIKSDDWALKTVVDLAPETVNAVTISPVDSESIEVSRNPESGELQLVEIPTDYQLKFDAPLNQLAGGLSRLMIDEALPTESSPLSNTDETSLQLSANYLLTSGEKVNLDVYHQGENYYMTIDSSLFPQYAGWVMKIASYKYNALNRELSEFIEPISDSDSTETDTNLDDSAGV